VRVGPYEIEGEIGAGGGGVVFRGRSRDGAILAIKVLKKTDPATIGRFERERRALERLGEAEGFVPLADFGAAPEGPWIAMPFLGGGTLRDRLQRGPVPVDDMLSWTRELARALGRAHALGIVHRDLKPENVLFTDDGRPLVADLGLAKHFVGPSQDGEPLSRTGDFRGTPGYCAPEQLMDAKSATPAADVFALGSILFEGLAGVPAFPGRTGIEIVQAELDGRHQPLSLVRKRAPRWLANVVARCLALAPEDRFEDGVALSRALAGPPARRPVALVAVGLMGLGLAGVFFLRAPATRPTPPTVRPTPPTTPPGVASLELVRLARTKLRSADARGALEDAERALALAPALPEARLALALALALQEKPDYGRALDAASAALAVDPGSGLALALHGAGRVWRGDADGRKECDRATTLAPNDPFVWAIRGHAREVSDDDDGVVADCTRALQVDPDHYWAIVWRARASGSRDDARRAFALAPEAITSWIALAAAEIEHQDFVAATDVCNRALVALPESPSLLGLRAIVAIRQQDPRRALPDIDRAIQLDGNGSQLYVVRSIAREMVGEHDAAVADAETALRLATDALRRRHAQSRLDSLKR
jgi:tetratricopeptide (TPR) repeat protein